MNVLMLKHLLFLFMIICVDLQDLHSVEWKCVFSEGNSAKKQYLLLYNNNNKNIYKAP